MSRPMSSPIARAAREAARNPRPRPAAQPASGHDHTAPGSAPIRQSRPEIEVPRHGAESRGPERIGELAPDHSSPARETPPSTPPGSVPLRKPGTAARFRRGWTTAQGVVATLALPALPSSLPARPLPLTGLHRLPRDTSMLYDIGQVDASGRVSSRDIVGALRWQPQDRLELILTAGAIVLRVSSDGLFSVPQRSRIIIPASARQRHAIRDGDHVLLAAAPDYGTVIVYPPSALDEMIASYHSAHPATGDEHE
jgi:hypothetical protein